MEDAIRTAHWWVDPKNHAEAVAIAAQVSKRPPAAFDKWLFVKAGQQGDYYRDPNMVPNLEALQANIDLQRELGFLKGPIDVAKHSDLSVVQEAGARVK
jgi:NitT/TauT family transport system substrate-binding protein